MEFAPFGQINACGGGQLEEKNLVFFMINNFPGNFEVSINYEKTRHFF